MEETLVGGYYISNEDVGDYIESREELAAALMDTTSNRDIQSIDWVKPRMGSSRHTHLMGDDGGRASQPRQGSSLFTRWVRARSGVS